MASPLHAHWDLIVQLRRRHKSYTDIAAELTKQGIATTANNLSNFYKRKIKTIHKIKAELALLDAEAPLQKESKKTLDSKSTSQHSDIQSGSTVYPDDTKFTITGPDDPWKPKLIRARNKRPEPDKPKPKNK